MTNIGHPLDHRKRLIAVGFTDDQAELLVKTYDSKLDTLATKDDVNKLQARMDERFEQSDAMQALKLDQTASKLRVEIFVMITGLLAVFSALDRLFS